ncbi:MAG: PH domain-containing protein, partial [Thermoanaerobaculia bacterium]
MTLENEAMALIPCPECSNQVSTAAVACPRCGFPVGSVPPDARSLASGSAPPIPMSMDEETLWEARPATLLLLGQILRTVVFLIVLAILDWAVRSYLLPSLSDPPPVLTEIRVALLAFLVAAALVRLLQAWVQVKTTSWRLTNQRLVVETGIFSKTLDNVDIRTVDDTKLRQSITGRLLGFGTVVVIS